MDDRSATPSLSTPPVRQDPPAHAQLPANPFGLRQGSCGAWRCNFRRNGIRIRRSTGTANFAEAVQTCTRWQLNGIDALPAQRRLRHTFDDLLRLVTEERRVSRISAGTLRIFTDRIRFVQAWYLRTYGEEAALHRIDRAVILSYVRWRQGTPVTRNGRKVGVQRLPRERTVMHDLDILRSLFRRAVAQGWMSEEPTRQVPRNRKAYQPRVRALRTDELRTFLAALKQQAATDVGTASSGLRMLPDFCELSFACGLRRDEVRLLTRSDVDLQKQTILIRPKTLPLRVVVPMSKEGYAAMKASLKKGVRPTRPRIPEFIPTAALSSAVWHADLDVLVVDVSIDWTLKGQARPRELPIPASALPLLNRLTSLTLSDWYPEAPSVLARRELGLPDPTLLFPGAEGGLLRSNMNREVNEAAAAAGLGSLRIHDLRHTYATLLRAKGVELATIQGLLGHEDLETTQMYAHYTGEEGRRAVAGLAW